MRRLIALPVLAAVALGLTLPDEGPVPLENPRAESPAGDTAPVLEARPEDKAGAATSDETEAEDKDIASKPAKVMKKPAPAPAITAPEPTEAALAHCEAELRKLGAVFERHDPLRGKNGCGIEAPYSLEQIVPGVTLAPASQVRCETALALARWTDTVVLPATEALSDEATLTAINHGSTYVCRRRNNAATGKMSEHAIGNAVDVMSFEFEGHDPIPVSPKAGDGTLEEAFQRAVRGGACLHFTTVLGPGSNASHADHLHLDIIERKRGYRLCE
ncbi:hypothetical protein SAMN05877838_1044 [Hoeflea halophila]|uniref:Extensin-like C-terminal domain-containing protein n=1 Tax=Hoeflea halophila TaxID=714899 RepID=A0A286I592_9HYPH|nr:extensin family protein [Hoeflea halophila]SOE15280.1 hypothetical protein SAMN05877838_1044 [Hoeflea halophila]